MFLVLFAARDQVHVDILVRMCTWADNGFPENLQTTHPSRLLELISKRSPSLLLLDGGMDFGMDLLQFLREVRKLNRHLQVILIADQRDFRLASEAIRLRFAALYIWEELSSEVLLRDLVDIKYSLDIQFHQSGVVKRQLLRDILKGKIPSTPETELFFEISDRHVEYVLFQIKRDFPYQIIPEELSPIGYYAVNWHGSKFPAEFNYIATVNVSMHAWCTLLQIKDTINMGRINSLSHAAALALQKSFSSQFDQTVSIAFSRPFEHFEDILFIQQQLDVCNKMQVFYGRARIMSPYDQPPAMSGYGQFYDEAISKLSSSLFQQDQETVFEQSNALFRRLSQDVYSYDTIRVICNSLVGLCEEFCKVNQIPKLKERIRYKQISASNCYSINEIGLWFCNVFQLLIGEARKIKKVEYSAKIQDIINYIDTNYCDNNLIGNISANFHISNDYLRHIFKAETGKSLTNYVTDIKIKKAKYLLKTQNFTISEIAQLTGFNTAPYFSSVFKKVEGITPRQFISQK